MYEDGIDVVYELARSEDVGGGWGPHGVVHLPGWCAGDPEMAVALHFHGHRSMVDSVRVVDWQPHEDEPRPCGAEYDVAHSCGLVAGHSGRHTDGRRSWEHEPWE